MTHTQDNVLPQMGSRGTGNGVSGDSRELRGEDTQQGFAEPT